MRRVAVVAWAWCSSSAASPRADGPGVGTPAVVAVGDSAISGEAGRWAGNTNSSSSRVDALGSTAYHDVPGREAIAGCHRSKSAEVHIGDGVLSANLACSGARTYSRVGDTFKPGHRLLQRQLGPQGPGAGAAGVRRDAQREGGRGADRRQQLRVRGHRPGVRHQLADVAVVVEELLPRRLGHQLALHESRVTTEIANVRGALQNVAQAMANAGYADVPYTILAQTYSSPLPRSGGFRYPETGWTRQSDRRLRRLEPRRQLGAGHGRDDVQQHDQGGGGHERPAEREGARCRDRAQRAAAVREQRRAARGERRRELDDRRARSTRASGCARSAP